MSMIPVCVGFDYHDDSIRICVMSESGQTLLNRSVANSVELVIQAVSRCARVAVCAVEACCGAADFAHQLSRRTGWTVRLVHPGYARRLKRSPDKSDHDDAQLLADLVRVKLPARSMASADRGSRAAASRALSAAAQAEPHRAEAADSGVAQGRAREAADAGLDSGLAGMAGGDRWAILRGTLDPRAAAGPAG